VLFTLYASLSFYHDVLLTNGDVAGNPSLIASKTLVIGDEVTLSSAFANIGGSGLIHGIKLMTTSGHDIGRIREYNKEDILALIDTAKDVKGTIIRSEPFIWHGRISFNGVIHYSVHAISSSFHCKLADN